jgi:hypothetical protein
MGGSGSDG